MEAATTLAQLTAGSAAASVLELQKQPTHPQTQHSQPTQTHVAIPQTIGQESKPNATSVNKQKVFPERLMDILNDETLADTVTWLPHGRSFVIIRPDKFTEEVLPKYLPPVDARSSTKYPSFTRKLNRWGFRQATRGPDTGAFQHHLFRRDQPELCLQMVCQRTSASSKQAERKNKKNNNTTATTTSRLPAKKRRVLLTKESLEAMTGAQQQTKEADNTPAKQAVATVSEDSLSNASADGSSDHNNKSWTVQLPQGVITNAAALTQKALAVRNEEERMRVARAMLYDAYRRAMRGE